jgi:sensor c-di-GMP phosphodiesterase-like protein
MHAISKQSGDFGMTPLCSTMVGQVAEPRQVEAQVIFLKPNLRFLRGAVLKYVGGSNATVLSSDTVSLILDSHEFDSLQNPDALGMVSLFDFHKDQYVFAHGASLSLPAARTERGSETASGRAGWRSCSESLDICFVAELTEGRVSELRSRSIIASTGIATIATAFLCSLVSISFRARARFPARLARALRTGQLYVLYQPIADLETGSFVGAEALVRWKDGPPTDRFIAEAEQLSLLPAITEFVIFATLRDLHETLVHNPRFYISINVSSDEIARGSIHETLSLLFQGTNVAPHQIVIEITERSECDFDTIKPKMDILTASGHPIYVDDFGSGYSNLSQITALHVDKIKLDRSFLASLSGDGSLSPILANILEIARTLETGIVIEGIEDETQAAVFRGRTPKLFGQGWYFAQPMSADRLGETLRNSPGP